METLQACKQRKSFTKFLQQKEVSVGGGLPSFLIMPIQRLPRYELLLKELLKNTVETNQDYSTLPLALKQLEKHTRKSNIAVLCSLSRVSEEFNREDIITEDGEEVKNASTPEENEKEDGASIDKAGVLEEQTKTKASSPKKKKEINGEVEGSPQLGEDDREKSAVATGVLPPQPGLKLHQVLSIVNEDEELKLSGPTSALQSAPTLKRKNSKRWSLSFPISKDKAIEEQVAAFNDKTEEGNKAINCSAFFVEKGNKEEMYAKAEAAKNAAVKGPTTTLRRRFRLSLSFGNISPEALTTNFQEGNKQEEVLTNGGDV